MNERSIIMREPKNPFDTLREHLGRNQDSAQQQMEKSIAKLAETEPHEVAYHLGWLTDLYQESARYEVYGRILAAIDPVHLEQNPSRVTWDSVREYVDGEVNRMGRYPNQSTSPCSNLIERYKLAAWAEVQEKMMNIAKYGETL